MTEMFRHFATCPDEAVRQLLDDMRRSVRHTLRPLMQRCSASMWVLAYMRDRNQRIWRAETRHAHRAPEDGSVQARSELADILQKVYKPKKKLYLFAEVPVGIDMYPADALRRTAEAEGMKYEVV